MNDGNELKRVLNLEGCFLNSRLRHTIIQGPALRTVPAMFRFNRTYFFLAVVLFIIELLIAIFVRDTFIRPYVGDYLVVMLIYCAVRTILQAPAWKTALGVLLFSYGVETLQYFQFINRLGLEDNVIARTVIGFGFEWADLIAYTLGILTVLAFEKRAQWKRERRKVDAGFL